MCHFIYVHVSSTASRLSINDSSPTLSTNSTEDLIVCRDDFFKANLICEPRCDSFEQGSHTDSLIMIYSEVIASGIALILSIAAVVLSIKDYKSMY